MISLFSCFISQFFRNEHGNVTNTSDVYNVKDPGIQILG